MNEICEIIELLLTANIYNKNKELEENDLPSDIRKHYWDNEEGSVKRPINVTIEDIRSIKGIDNPNQYLKSGATSTFVDFTDSYNKQLYITTLDVATNWFSKQPAALDAINKNPVLASYYDCLLYTSDAADEEDSVD